MRTCIVLLAVVVGCGGGGGVSVGDLPDSIDDNRCDRAVACQAAQDRATCEAATQFDVDDYGTIEAAVKDGTIKYDSGAAADCASSFGNTNCNFAGFHQKDPCEEIFEGTVATGGACVIDLQCANNGNCMYANGCNPNTMCCTGTCVAGTPPATESPIGGPCSDELHFCGTNAYCKTPTGTPTGTCTALVTNEGGMCDEIDACSNPMYCNLPLTGGGMGTCKKGAASKAACLRTDLLPCADSRDFCDPTTLTCIRDLAVGAACQVAGVQCVAYSSCVNGVCTADIPAGGACTAIGADCAIDLECIQGTCQLQPLSNMTCMLP